MIFIDTSAIYAVLNADDEHHARAAAIWRDLLASDRELLTTNYVVLETSAIVQGRLGLEALADVYNSILPLIGVEYIDSGIHEAALHLVLAEKRRRLSLVDCTSFVVMRRNGVRDAFAFDAHFGDFGFQLLP